MSGIDLFALWISLSIGAILYQWCGSHDWLEAFDAIYWQGFAFLTVGVIQWRRRRAS